MNMSARFYVKLQKALKKRLEEAKLKAEAQLEANDIAKEVENEE